jgi:Flp pilus assembly protein TadD
MKKVLVLLAGTVGFMLGSRAGRGPYEQVERWVRQVAKRPEVRQVGDQLSASTSQVSDAAARAASSVAKQTSDAATHATQAAADTVSHGIDKAGPQASEKVDEAAGHLGN